MMARGRFAVECSIYADRCGKAIAAALKGGGEVIGGSAARDLEGNSSLTVGSGEGVATSSTVDISLVTVKVCH